MAGALYFNTTDDIMKVYDGSVWVAAYASLSGALLQSNNLSDVLDVAASRTNLGLGTAATTASTAYATAAQGALADSAVQPNDSPSFGSVTVTGTVDGRDVAADGSKLDGIEAGATADQTAGEIKTAYESNANTNAYTDAEQSKLAGIASGAEVNTVDSVNTQTGAVVLDADDISDAATTNKFTTAAEISKLAGIEAGANVTDTANVTAAGALMDSEVTNLAQVKAFDSSDYATAAQGSLADSALQSGDNVSALTNDAGYTTNTGDITNVSAGTGLSGGGASGSVTLNVDLSELTDMTATMVGTDEFIVLDAGADRRKAANEIGLSIFSNDAGFTTNVGDITGVTAGTSLTGGGTSGTVTINHADTSTLSGTYGSTANGTKIDRITVDALGHVTAITTGATGDIEGVTAGTGLTGGGTSGTVTLNGVTQSEATWEAGTGTTESLVSPAKVKAAIDALAGGGDFAPVAWADWNGVSSSLNNSGNVSSLSDYGTGYWGINFSNSLPVSTYSFAGGGVSATDATGGFIASDMGYNTNVANKTTSGMRHRAQKSNTQAWVDFYNNSTLYTI